MIKEGLPSRPFDPADEAVAFASGDFGGAVPEGRAEEEEVTGVFEVGLGEGIASEFKLAALVFAGVGELQDKGEFAFKGVFAEFAAVLMPVIKLAVGAVVFRELPLGAAVLQIKAKGGIGAEDLALDATEEPEEIQVIVAQPANGGTAEFFINPTLTAMTDDGRLGGVIFNGMFDQHGAFFRGQECGTMIPVIAGHVKRGGLSARRQCFGFFGFE